MIDFERRGDILEKKKEQIDNMALDERTQERTTIRGHAICLFGMALMLIGTLILVHTHRDYLVPDSTSSNSGEEPLPASDEQTQQRQAITSVARKPGFDVIHPDVPTGDLSPSPKVKAIPPQPRQKIWNPPRVFSDFAMSRPVQEPAVPPLSTDVPASPESRQLRETIADDPPVIPDSGELHLAEAQPIGPNDVGIPEHLTLGQLQDFDMRLPILNGADRPRTLVPRAGSTGYGYQIPCPYCGEKTVVGSTQLNCHVFRCGHGNPHARFAEILRAKMEGKLTKYCGGPIRVIEDSGSGGYGYAVPGSYND